MDDGDTDLEERVLLSRMYFSFKQFFVFDRSVKLPACSWTQAHYDQGFARRTSNAAFSTLLEFGHADVAVCMRAYGPSGAYQRVIEIPLEIPSGVAVVAGPEEFDDERVVQLERGHYRLTVAQSVEDDDTQLIDLYFEALDSPQLVSHVLVADGELHPSDSLLETAEEVVLEP